MKILIAPFAIMGALLDVIVNATIGTVLFLIGFAVGLRFLYFYMAGEGDGHIQSVILSAVLLGMGFQTMLVAFIADLQATNRKLLEDIQYSLRKIRTRTVRIDADRNSTSY